MIDKKINALKMYFWQKITILADWGEIRVIFDTNWQFTKFHNDTTNYFWSVSLNFLSCFSTDSSAKSPPASLAQLKSPDLQLKDTCKILSPDPSCLTPTLYNFQYFQIKINSKWLQNDYWNNWVDNGKIWLFNGDSHFMVWLTNLNYLLKTVKNTNWHVIPS